MAGFVVGWNSDVDEFQGCICISQCDNWDIDVGGFTNSLVVHSGIRDDDEPWFFEGAGDVVREGTGGETACDGLGAGVGGIFENCTVSVWSGGDDADIVWVFDGCDYTGGEDDFLPGLSDVYDVNTCITCNGLSGSVV